VLRKFVRVYCLGLSSPMPDEPANPLPVLFARRPRSMESGKLLRNVDLDIYEGELVVLLGPSGSGKSINDRVFLHEDHDAGCRPDRRRREQAAVRANAALVGSSQRSTSRDFAKACATATLCCSPPDNCEGKRSRRFSRLTNDGARRGSKRLMAVSATSAHGDSG
jgi:hypothetical protein